jgi:hypothetical protein
MIMAVCIIMSVSLTDKMTVNAHPLYANNSSADSTVDPMEVHIVDEEEQAELTAEYFVSHDDHTKPSYVDDVEKHEGEMF